MSRYIVILYVWCYYAFTPCMCCFPVLSFYIRGVTMLLTLWGVCVVHTLAFCMCVVQLVAMRGYLCWHSICTLSLSTETIYYLHDYSSKQVNCCQSRLMWCWQLSPFVFLVSLCVKYALGPCIPVLLSCGCHVVLSVFPHRFIFRTSVASPPSESASPPP